MRSRSLGIAASVAVLSALAAAGTPTLTETRQPLVKREDSIKVGELGAPLPTGEIQPNANARVDERDGEGLTFSAGVTLDVPFGVQNSAGPRFDLTVVSFSATASALGQHTQRCDHVPPGPPLHEISAVVLEAGEQKVICAVNRRSLVRDLLSFCACSSTITAFHEIDGDDSNCKTGVIPQTQSIQVFASLANPGLAAELPWDFQTGPLTCDMGVYLLADGISIGSVISVTRGAGTATGIAAVTFGAANVACQ